MSQPALPDGWPLHPDVQNGLIKLVQSDLARIGILCEGQDSGAPARLVQDLVNTPMRSRIRLYSWSSRQSCLRVSRLGDLVGHNTITPTRAEWEVSVSQ